MGQHVVCVRCEEINISGTFIRNKRTPLQPRPRPHHKSYSASSSSMLTGLATTATTSPGRVMVIDRAAPSKPSNGATISAGAATATVHSLLGGTRASTSTRTYPRAAAPGCARAQAALLSSPSPSDRPSPPKSLGKEPSDSPSGQPRTGSQSPALRAPSALWERLPRAPSGASNSAPRAESTRASRPRCTRLLRTHP